MNDSASALPVLLNGISILAARREAEPGQGARQEVWPEMSREDDAFGDPKVRASPPLNTEGESPLPSNRDTEPAVLRGWKELGDGLCQQRGLLLCLELARSRPLGQRGKRAFSLSLCSWGGHEEPSHGRAAEGRSHGRTSGRGRPGGGNAGNKFLPI